MQLFKRMMLSLFPDEMVNNPMNPASIFVGFISAKQYFSVITRKIVENYKLNLFDISLDPFEVKIGFGDSPTIKVKDVDFYYGYAAAANLNGYRSYAPGQIAHMITLVTSVYTVDIFEEYDEYYTIQFLYAVYLLTFLFQAKCKVFPSDNVKENFSWYVEVLFSLYEFLLDQSGKKYLAEDVKVIKAKLLQNHIDIVFMLFYFYTYASKSLDMPGIQPSQFYGWLLYDELKGGNVQPLAQDFLDNAHVYTKSTKLSTTEKNLIHLFFPADILIRYLVEGGNVVPTIRHFITHFFDKNIVTTYLHSFLKNDAKFDDFVTYITDYMHIKTSYFDAMKKYMTHMFQKKDAYNPANAEEMDERMSAIGEGGAIDMARIPARLKQESETMEKLMNFYITYIGGYRIGRGDSRYMRSFYQECMHELMENMAKNTKHDTYHYFSGLLYSYSKNVFYYKYAFENIRAGKDKFHLPFRATFREVYSNACIVKLFESSFIADMLQDLLPKDIKIYIKNPSVVAQFAHHFQHRISALIRQKPQALLQSLYGVYDSYFPTFSFTDVIKSHFAKHDIAHIKENMYTLDFWVYTATIDEMQLMVGALHEKYGDASISGILATLRETILGFYMYCSYSKQQADLALVSAHIDELCKIYIVDVLNMSDEFVATLLPLLKTLLHNYNELFGMMNGIDDNKGYLQIARDNRNQYCFQRRTEDIFGGLSGEDIIWFRGFLKTISYYNKRYIIPHT